MIAAGKTDDEIRTFMIERYGDFVLYRPRMTAAISCSGPRRCCCSRSVRSSWCASFASGAAESDIDPDGPGGRSIVTPFILICAVMVVAAIAFVARAAAAQRCRLRPRASRPRRADRRSLVALVIALPLAAAALYARISNFPWDNPIAAAAVPRRARRRARPASMNEVMAQLEARLAAEPGRRRRLAHARAARTWCRARPRRRSTAYEKADRR